MLTADNWEAVVELELCAGQEDLVASNLYSVAEAQFYHDERPRVPSTQGSASSPCWKQKMKCKVQEVSINCFMIDRKHQGKGYGRAALKPFYVSLGLVEVVRDRDGEVIVVLKL